MSIDVPTQFCPCCHAELETASWIGIEPGDTPARPESGDLTFCLYCASLLKFGDGLVLSTIPADQRQQLLDASLGLRTVLAEVAKASKRYQASVGRA